MSEQVDQHIKDRFQFLRKIGSGAYGHVWKVKDKQNDNEIVALKKIFDAFQHGTDAQRTYRQISYLKMFNHKNIIKLREVIKSEEEKDVYLVFDFMEVDLHRVIREDILKEKHKRYIIYQIAKSIKYLHSGELIHRDLKPSNVLVNQECIVKLCDFGLVRSATAGPDKEELMMTEYVATRWYRAPELLLGWNKYSKAIDIWSFGCLIAEMFRGKPLFPGSSTLDQLQKVICWTGYPTPKDLDSIRGYDSEGLISVIKASKHRPTLKQQWFVNIEPNLKSLITKMLQFHPSKRPTIQQILQHPFLSVFHNPDDQPSAKHPIHIQVGDSTKLSVKAYKQRIWRFCNNSRAMSPEFISIKKTQHLSSFSRSNIKRRSLKSSTNKQQKSISKTLFLKNKKILPSFKSSVISPPIIVQSKTPSRQHRRLTQTQNQSRNKILSYDHKPRYKNQSRNLQRQKSLNNSNNFLNKEQVCPKKRSVSKRNTFICNDYRKGFIVI